MLFFLMSKLTKKQPPPALLVDIMKMSVSEAAKLLEVSEQFVRCGLRQGVFPFGFAVKESPNRYTYYINRKGVLEWLGNG